MTCVWHIRMCHSWRRYVSNCVCSIQVHLWIFLHLPGHSWIVWVLVGGGKLRERVALKEALLSQLTLCVRLRHSMAKRLWQSLWQLTPHTEKQGEESRCHYGFIYTDPKSCCATLWKLWKWLGLHTFAFVSLFVESPYLKRSNNWQINNIKMDLNYLNVRNKSVFIIFYNIFLCVLLC